MLHNFFDWLFWDAPEEGAWTPGLTFEDFNVEWRDVNARNFDENSTLEEKMEGMRAFVEIWLSTWLA